MTLRASRLRATRRRRRHHVVEQRWALPAGVAVRPGEDGGAAMADGRDGKAGVGSALPTDALRDAGQQLLGLLVQRAADAATQRVSGLTDRLTDVSDNGGNFRAVLRGNRSANDGQARGEDDSGAGDGSKDEGSEGEGSQGDGDDGTSRGASRVRCRA